MKSSLVSILLPLLVAAGPIEKRQYASTNTANQLTDGTPCREVSVLFARGTFEFGNIGMYTGPPFLQAVADKLGSSNVAGQGVDYSADVFGFFMGGSDQGATTMAGVVTATKQRCPNTKFVLSGYSQGVQVARKAAAKLSADETAFIDSVVLFGDPNNGQAVGQIPASKVKTFCHADDNICQGGINFLGSHLTYSKDAGAAADFVAQQAQ